MSSNRASKAWDMISVLGRGGPGLCNIAVTNACNAACDFCNFARGKIRRADLCWIDSARFEAALNILYSRDIRYVSFFGGEPLLHPELANMIRMAVARGMGPGLITNGWLLPSKLDELAVAGLKTIDISIDAPAMADHEKNRGLEGLGDRIRIANSRMKELNITPIAQVTINKLIRDYCDLVPLLRDLGFEAVAFSYPQRSRLGSSSLAWSDSSGLVNFTDAELIEEFDSVNRLRKLYPVNNPSASIEDMKRHLRGEEERFVCYGGYKSFFMDWNYTIWRCDAWKEPLCSVWDFDRTELVRDGCTACIADCYRDSSVMLHFAVSIGDSIGRLKQGKPVEAWKTLVDSRNLTSLFSILENAPIIARMAKIG